VTGDPFAAFTEWFDQARLREPGEPDAVALASADANGRPTARMVLMRAYDARGFVFYTNLGSRKVSDFAHNPYCSMCFHWKTTDRQVRIEGRVEQVTDAEADAYFASRPRESQIGAWASKQSKPLDARAVLEERVVRYTERFADGPVPRPEFWSGYRLIPDSFEFWDKRPYRLHDRTHYTRTDTGWQVQKLYP